MKSKIEPQQVSDKETAILLELLNSTANVPGDVVELGCYKGNTSLEFERVLEKSQPEKHLWLYDSFEGLPAKTKEDNSVAGDNFKAGELLVTKREVVMRFKKAGLKVPRIRKNFFENLDPEQDFPELISFAFLDGDLYGSIKTSLELVWKKLDKNAVVVVHDYNNPELPGVSKALEEWSKNHHFTITQRETLAIIKLI
ncbi:class I SAM-dependent methyltransferase [Candidatus Saccharibacteria bacterium]|nr:class I SAM-dependent methyltransferase [Candidatus Saccharibacteria bacterium]